MIIIGILAAIAIPTFLSQRDSADDAAAKSDVRNIAAAASAFAADNNGSYSDATSDMSITRLENEYSLNLTDAVTGHGVTVKNVGSGTDNGFTATATSAAGNTFTFDSETGQVT